MYSTIEQRRGARRASDSVEEVYPRENGSVTIEREAAAGTRVVCVGLRDVRGVDVGVIVNHVVAHVVGPFENLGSNVDKESVGGLPT
jgi:hypothetical protein